MSPIFSVLYPLAVMFRSPLAFKRFLTYSSPSVTFASEVCFIVTFLPIVYALGLGP